MAVVQPVDLKRALVRDWALQVIAERRSFQLSETTVEVPVLDSMLVVAVLGQDLMLAAAVPGRRQDSPLSAEAL